MSLNGEEYAIRPLLSAGAARIYMLASIDAAARAATRSALVALGTIALWAFVLAGFASLWLARTLTDPINRVSHTIATMTGARDFSRTLEPTRTSRELDVLTASFNELMGGGRETETRAPIWAPSRVARLRARVPVHCSLGAPGARLGHQRQPMRLPSRVAVIRWRAAARHGRRLADRSAEPEA